MPWKFIRHALSSLEDLFYPPACPVCGRLAPSRERACDACEPGLIRLSADARIDLPSKIWISRARSCFAYDGPLLAALHSFKYNGRLDCERFFARAMHGEIEKLGRFDLVTAVPLHGVRLCMRGFNPAALLAKRISRSLGIKLDYGTLRRAGNKPRQVGLSREQRIRNVRDAFSAKDASRQKIEGRRILLVDDVLTTGATVNECARVLASLGAGEVCALTVARAL